MFDEELSCLGQNNQRSFSNSWCAAISLGSVRITEVENTRIILHHVVTEYSQQTYENDTLRGLCIWKVLNIQILYGCILFRMDAPLCVRCLRTNSNSIGVSQHQNLYGISSPLYKSYSI